MKSIILLIPTFLLFLSAFAFAQIVPLKEIQLSDQGRVKSEILQGAELAYHEGLIPHPLFQGYQIPTTIFPIESADYDNWKRADTHSGLSQVYLDDTNQTIGFILASPDPSRTQTASISKIWVRSDWRNKGIGKQLMHAVANSSLHYGLTEAELLVLKVNKVAQTAYFRYGFQNQAELEFTNSDGGNAFLYKGKLATILEKTSP